MLLKKMPEPERIPLPRLVTISRCEFCHRIFQPSSPEWEAHMQKAIQVKAEFQEHLERALALVGREFQVLYFSTNPKALQGSPRKPLLGFKDVKITDVYLIDDSFRHCEGFLDIYLLTDISLPAFFLGWHPDCGHHVYVDFSNRLFQLKDFDSSTDRGTIFYTPCERLAEERPELGPWVPEEDQLIKHLEH